MNTRETVEMMIYVSRKMVEAEPMLTEVDQAIGDGDHGLGIERGFSNVHTYLSGSFDAKDPGDVLAKVGTKLLTTMGGASGAIFGTLFRNGGKAIIGSDELTTATLAQFLETGLEGIYKRGGADEGAKTMIDALAPASRAARALSSEDLHDSIEKVVSAAEQGVEKTKDMIATTGKAKTLGERSLGYPDPGAISMRIILSSMSEFIAMGEPA